jgi:hypothetical protein
MHLPWRREPLTGEPLLDEARRLCVSLYDLPYDARLKPSGAPNPSNEHEIRRRIQIARSDRRLNRIQSVGIVLGLVLTAGIALWHGHVESKRESADMMLKFDERLSSGASRPVATALEMDGNLDHAKVSDEQIDEFLGNYELLAAAYRNDLIDKDMAEDAFSWQLETALNDSRIRSYLTAQRREEADFWDGVLELARAWNIKFPPLPVLPPAKPKLPAATTGTLGR